MTRTIFFGSPEAAVPGLRALAARTEVAGVVTQPDRPRGRSGAPQPSPVAEAATAMGLEVHKPDRLSSMEELASTCDLGVLIAYGRIVRPALLNAPRFGIVNVHFSLLPRWRGAAPVQRAILAGDEWTGVTLMQMDEGLDTGPMLAASSTRIGDLEDAGSLTTRLADLGGDLLAAELERIVSGAVAAQAQDEGRATAAPKFSSADAALDVSGRADVVLRAIRAFSPRPGAWVELEGSRFKILEARPIAASPSAPGQIVGDDGAPMLSTGDGALELVTVQPAGKPPMSGSAWFNGRSRRPAQVMTMPSRSSSGSG